MQSQRDYVLRTVEERGIRFVQLWFTDVLGTPKGFNIPTTELDNALDEGMTFDGSAIDGFSRVQEADVLARPDPKTFQLLPWQQDDAQVARVFCDIANLDGTPFEGDPRHALRRTLERARAAGYTFFASPEVEFFYFADADPARGPVTLDSGSYFDLSVADLTSNLRRRSVLMLEEMGIPVEHTQHEDARSQHEIDLRYTDALTMADTVMTTRMVIKEMARQEGVFASFMPKPLGRRAGLGHAHPHLAVAGRAQRVRRRERPLRALGGGAPLHRRAAAPRPRDHRRHQPVGQLLQAAHRGLRGARPRQLGAQQPLGAGAGARRQDGQDRVHAGLEAQHEQQQETRRRQREHNNMSMYCSSVRWAMSSASASIEMPALMRRTLDWLNTSLLNGMLRDALRVIF